MGRIDGVQGIDYIVTIEKKIKERNTELYNQEIVDNVSYLEHNSREFRYRAFSVDTSNVPVELEYTGCCYVRCADSDGNVYLENVFPNDMPKDMMKEYLEQLIKKEPYKYLFETLELTKWEEITYLNPQRANDADSFIKIVRDLCEWAVLLKILSEEKNCIVIKDGLLRNKLFKYEKGNPDNTYVKLKEKVKELCLGRKNVLVGIAKKSKVVEIVKQIIKPYRHKEFSRPFTIRVANDSPIMDLSYNYQLYREGEIVFGNSIYVTSFISDPTLDKLCAIEIPDWHEKDYNLCGTRYMKSPSLYIIECLYSKSIRMLPTHTSGLPAPLVIAHENAKTMQADAKLIEYTIVKNVKKA